jgi:hypothetical protein
MHSLPSRPEECPQSAINRYGTRLRSVLAESASSFWLLLDGFLLLFWKRGFFSLADWLSFLNDQEARHLSLLMSFVRACFNGLGKKHIIAAFLNGANKGTNQGLKPKEASYAHGFLLWE